MSHWHLQCEERPFEQLPSIEPYPAFHLLLDHSFFTLDRQVVSDKIDSEEIEISLTKLPIEDGFQVPAPRVDPAPKTVETPLHKSRKSALNPRVKFQKEKVKSPGVPGDQPECREQRDCRESAPTRGQPQGDLGQPGQRAG